MKTNIKIDKKTLGENQPCFIIAEVGVNHGGDLEIAKRLIDEAARAGVDAVKFQTFKAETLVSAEAPKAQYQIKNTNESECQFDMIKRLELSEDDHRALMAYCEEKCLIFISSAFDESSADFLEELGVPAFKIPSGEITNLALLKHIAKKGAPIILSTGMSSLKEVAAAVEAIEAADNQQILVLHCVSNYPADPSDVNLRAMQTMESAFGHLVGYSDHVHGNEVAFAAVAVGARLIEKHLTLDKTMAGPDHLASTEPDSLMDLVKGIRTIEQAMGDGKKRPAISEADTASVARKSLVTADHIPAGTLLTKEMISVKRPGTGIAPEFIRFILGRTTRMELLADTLITLEDLE